MPTSPQGYEQLKKLFLNSLDECRTCLKQRRPRQLYEPCAYILSLGGKRLRPLLALIACDLFDAPPAAALNSALAVELFHNFSLIHDDILDNAPLRRGKPTVHTKWGQNIAILAGDVMLVESGKTLEGYSPSLYRQLSTLLNSTAVLVCEGQQLDMNFENLWRVGAADYLNMIRLKTAVLLGCSLQMGALCAGASKKNQETLYRFGEHLGISFQLLDDYLDVFSNNSKGFGKVKAGDILSGKKTFLVIKALEMSNAGQRKQLKALYNDLNVPAQKKINQVSRIFEESGAANACLIEAEKHTALALSYLDKLKVSVTKKNVLKNFSLELLHRHK